MPRYHLSALPLLLLTVSCGGAREVPETTEPITVANVGFATPESVLHDVQTDVYLVSNINGDPFAKDDNGFITRLSPNGEVLALKWIDGTAEGVTLNAPKGMAISGDVLYVADITTVRMFNRISGEPMGEIMVQGATFLNDLAPGEAGGVYLTDSGFNPGFEPSGTDAVYHISSDGSLTRLAAGSELGGPNGVFEMEKEVWVATFGTGQLYQVADGHVMDAITLPTGSLDGLEIHEGQFYVSSWEGQSVLRGSPGQGFSVVVPDVQAPADIGFDVNRGRILIPLFQTDEVRLVPVG